MRDGLISLMIFFGVVVVCWMAVKLINYLRRKNTNTELWATVFEGMTNKTIDITPLKEPTVYIEKKAGRSGRDKDNKTLPQSGSMFE